jgi:transcriptional regulator with XRE-family HTH domain
MASDAPAIASRLQMARKLSGLSQGQVAKSLGMQRPTISEIEAGRRRVAAEELVAFAKLYSVSIEWLATGPSEQPNSDEIRSLAARRLEKMTPEDIGKVIELLSVIEEQRRGQKDKT